jgi:MYXO-CTERM domain-containing protein
VGRDRRAARGSGASRSHRVAPGPSPQLYEPALGLIAVVALWAVRRRWTREAPGRVFLITAANYEVGRILIEDLRGDAGR